MANNNLELEQGPKPGLLNPQDVSQPVRQHVRFMDGLRGIAVLMVALYHGNEQGLLDSTLKFAGLEIVLPGPFMRAGGVGVEIFYFISGFVLMYPLAQHAFEGRPLQTLRQYFERRALKIVPSYVIALVVLTLVIPLEIPAGDSLFLHFLAHLFFLHGLTQATFISINGPLWTLAIEIEFYLVFPFIARPFMKRPLATYLGMLVVSIAYQVTMHLTGYSQNFFLSNQLPDFLSLFGAGMYASWTVVRYRGIRRPLVEQKRWTAAAIVAMFVFYGFLGVILNYGGPQSWQWSNDHRDLEGIVLFVLAVGTAFGHETWRNLLSSRVLLFLGTISYNLYLWNKNIYVWYREHYATFVNALPWGYLGNVGPMFVALLLPFAVATAVTFLIERPILAGGWSAIWQPTLAAYRRLPKMTRTAGVSGDLDAIGLADGPRRPWYSPLAAYAAAFVPLAVFAQSMPHVASTAEGNELITVSYVLGIAHATGYPLFIALGWLFSHAIPYGWVAWRIVIISVFSTTLAAWLLTRVVRAFGGEAWIATGCALVFATGDAVWGHATAPGYAALTLLLFAASVDALIGYVRLGGRSRLVRAGLFAGLGVAVHPILLLMLPGIAVVAAARETKLRSRASVTAASVAIGSALAGMLVYLLIPVRALAIAASNADPLRALGKPASEPIFNYDDPTNPAGFFRLIFASDYGPPAWVNAWRDIGGLPIHIFAVIGSLVDQLGGLPFAVAVIGAALVVRRSRVIGIVLIAFGVLPAFTALGFAVGDDGSGFDLYLLWIAAVFFGVGTTAIVRLYDASRRNVRRACAIALLAAGSAATVIDGHALFAQTTAVTDPIVDQVRSATAPNAIVIAPWGEALALAESAYAEKALDARIVDPSFLAQDAPFVASWLATRPVYAIGVPANYADPALRLTLVEGAAGAPNAISAVELSGSKAAPPTPFPTPLPAGAPVPPAALASPISTPQPPPATPAAATPVRKTVATAAPGR